MRIITEEKQVIKESDKNTVRYGPDGEMMPNAEDKGCVAKLHIGVKNNKYWVKASKDLKVYKPSTTEKVTKKQFGLDKYKLKRVSEELFCSYLTFLIKRSDSVANLLDRKLRNS